MPSPTAMVDQLSLSLLESLPRELLAQIFVELCHHCRLEPLDALGDDRKQDSDLKGLRALTCTSARLRSVSLPILFHDPQRHGAYLEISYIFSQQFELLKCIKVLSLPIRRKTDITGVTTLSPAAEKLAAEISPYENSYSYEDLESELFLAACSKLQHLTLQIVDDPRQRKKKSSMTFFQHISSLRRQIPAFPELRYLELDTSRCRRFSIAGRELALFLTQSPRLESLSLAGKSIGRSPDVHHSDLEDCSAALKSLKSLSLTIWSLFEDDVDFIALCQMISKASALTAFTYTAGRGRKWGSLNTNASDSREEISPHSLVDKLRFQKFTLRKLHLNFVNEAYLFNADFPSVFVSPAQLHEFTHLESLTLDVSSYCRHIFDREDIGPELDESTCLIELLPSTICDLTIIIHDVQQEEYWLDLIHLGKHVVLGRHLGLRRLQVNVMLVVRDAISASQDQEYEDTREERTRKILAVKEPDIRKAFQGSEVQLAFKLPADFE